MSWFSRILRIAQKEIWRTVSTPLLFILETAFVFLTGYFFYGGIYSYSQLSGEWLAQPELQKGVLEPTAIILPALFSNYALLLLFFVPLLTMSSFSGERRSGTLELLFTLPVRDSELVLGKWLGAVSILLFMLAPLWIYPWVYQLFGGSLSFETFGSGFLGLLLLVFFFTGVGIFVSSLFESQTASAVLTAGILVFLWSLESVTDSSLKFVNQFLIPFSVQKYFQPFSRGLVSTEAGFFFCLATAFFLFLTCRSLEKRSFRNPF
jgi:ABC-2 type transport system permease protein